MPHCKNGHELKAGDKVTVECVVENVGAGNDWCNVTLKTCEPCKPGTEPTTISLNASQCCKCDTENTPDPGANQEQPTA